MILLDTNVLSELMREDRHSAVTDWLDRQRADEVWTSAISVFELRFGMARLAEGRRKASLETALERVLRRWLGGRILTFDALAATEAASLAARRAAIGRPAEIRDTMIAGVVLAQRATLATRNIRHFDDLGAVVVDPWAG
jgi:toxin FitB